jgi:hypothetical protein
MSVSAGWRVIDQFPKICKQASRYLCLKNRKEVLDMKITGVTSYITVEIGVRKIKIQGKETINGFVAETDSIKNWESPYNHLPIDKEELIDQITENSKNFAMKVTFK